MRLMLYTLLELKAKAPPVHLRNLYFAITHRSGKLVRGETLDPNNYSLMRNYE